MQTTFFTQLVILLMFSLSFAPKVSGDFIPDHSWLFLLLVFSETLEIAEHKFNFFLPDRGISGINYFILFQQTEEFLFGWHS